MDCKGHVGSVVSFPAQCVTIVYIHSKSGEVVPYSAIKVERDILDRGACRGVNAFFDINREEVRFDF